MVNYSNVYQFDKFYSFVFAKKDIITKGEYDFFIRCNIMNDLFNTHGLNFLLIFIEGIISFFSPCVIPLIPIYMSYLAGNAKITKEDGTIVYIRKKVFFHTVFFVLGISFAFFVLGMAFSTAGNFFRENQILFTRIGGIIIVVLGLFQLGIFDLGFLQKERKFHLNIADKNMNPILAFIMGFTFSFAWTPCIGPALSSVLILASGAKNVNLSYALVLIYTLGFVIPFLALGLFTTAVLSFLKARQNLVKYTIKIGGIILIVIGIMTFTGWMNGISSYLNFYSTKQSNNTENTNNATSTDNQKDDTSTEDETTNDLPSEDSNSVDNEAKQDNEATNEEDNTESNVIPIIDFTLTDQYGNTHTLSDYKGKVIFLNFWATWCGPCQREMPDIQELYEQFGENSEDVIILGVANPSSDNYPNNQDEDKETIIKFLDDNEYTFPVVFDETGEILNSYYINAFPTTFFINKDGNIVGYAPGMLTKDQMDSNIKATLESTK
ncbi:MAG: hypothetical protein K0S41_575 [Anaerocolumna sp.]|jgi:cytochrome c-type biogenesis protein|nr:hypothetical protein [Anaerocolumna sp.]